MSPEVLEAAVNAPGSPSTPRIVLASGSMARARMLRDAGLTFTSIRPEVDEDAAKSSLKLSGESTEAAALALARIKAAAVGGSVEREALVIASDQLLELGDLWLSKPTDRDAARAQLTDLGGRPHRLVSAVTVQVDGQAVWDHVDAAVVTFRALTPAFLEHYLATVAPETLGSVGGYHAEGRGAQLIERIEGDWFTVMGMPLFPLLAFLRERGLLLR